MEDSTLQADAFTQDAHSFAGHVAIICGGGSGIGREIALSLASAGATVAILGRTQTKLNAVVEEIRRQDRTAVAHAADVSCLASLENAVDSIEQELGPVSLGVQCAASGTGQRFLQDMTETDWLRTINTNLNGSFRFCRTVVPRMLTGGRGSIVLMSSVAGQRGVVANSAYCASKHGVHGLVKALAIEVGRQGIRVNAVCPGLTDTEMVRDEHLYGADFMDSVREHFGPPDLTWERYWRSTVRSTSLQHLVDPAEVAALTLYLLSDANQSITGQALLIDGGMP